MTGENKPGDMKGSSDEGAINFCREIEICRIIKKFHPLIVFLVKT